MTKMEFDLHSVMRIRAPVVIDEVLLKCVQQSTPCDGFYEMSQEK